MSRSLLYSCAILALTSVAAEAQIGEPGVQYSTQIAAGDGGQLYPYDRQDPWLHGHFQRMPAYGGFASFRPYNYRHVFAQTQIAGQWGHVHGMPYSQQFWNKYRTSYLQGNLHSQSVPQPTQQPLIPGRAEPVPVFRTSYDQPAGSDRTAPAQSTERPIHVYPAGYPVR